MQFKIYSSYELNKKSTCSILEQVAADGKVRKMNFYNLDMIISVGYRVNSKRATQFRIWATNVLKEHLVKGYTINEKQLLQTQSRLRELQKAIDFLQEKAKHNLLTGQEQEILNLLAHLLYFIIKDHPFVDGNKRIGSFLLKAKS
ncbi:MAG: virulence protein RhuM/Fic/DOC family protein [bacterium]